MSAKKTPAKKPTAKTKKSKKSPPKAKPPTVYAVQRRMSGNEGFADGEPERIFADKQAALEYAAERSRACRSFLNPFEWGVETIKGGEAKLISVLKQLGLNPKPRKKWFSNDWSGWWDEFYHDLTETQRTAIWDALDKLELYRVVPVVLEG